MYLVSWSPSISYLMIDQTPRSGRGPPSAQTDWQAGSTHLAINTCRRVASNRPDPTQLFLSFAAVMRTSFLPSFKVQSCRIVCVHHAMFACGGGEGELLPLLLLHDTTELIPHSPLAAAAAAFL